jgi:hypothetical protein
VDLGRSQPIARVVVYNRLDYAPGFHNADNLVLATSDDGSTWTRRYDNGGKFFGGVTGAKPLEVVFAAGEVRARFVRLLVPSNKPIYFHLDEVEVYGPADPAANLALGRPADQSSLSQWSTAKVREGPEPGAAYPTRETIERGRRLAADLGHAGVDIRPHQKALDEAASRLAALPADAPADARRALYLDARRAVRRLAFANPLLNFDRFVFVKRFTQETYPDVCLNHMPWVSRPGGDICVLTGLDGPREVRPILAGALGPGHVHGMDLWWDADRVVFGYAKARSDQPPAGWLDRATNYRLRRSEEPIHLFEVGIDGRGLRQLTRGEWSDLDPTYLPGGEIAFASERCGYSLQCNEYDKDETSCNLYVMRPDGTRIRRLSVTKDGDYLPHTLDDGTIGYTRWEYQERGWANVQSLWFVRPDGTGADALFKQHFNNPWAVEEARSIPGSHRLVAVATGHHTLPAGPVVILDPAVAMNDPAGIRIVTPGVRPPEGGMAGTPVPEGGVADASGLYMTPWPLSEKYFLVSYGFGGQTAPAGYGIYLIDVFGTKAFGTISYVLAIMHSDCTIARSFWEGVARRVDSEPPRKQQSCAVLLFSIRRCLCRRLPRRLLSQPPRPIGGDGVYAAGHEAFCFGGVVDGPDMELEAGVMDLLYEFRIDSVVRFATDAVGADFLQGGQSFFRTWYTIHQPVRLHLPQSLLCGGHGLAVEGDDDNLFGAEGGARDRLLQGGNDSNILHLDVDLLALRHGREHLFNRGDSRVFPGVALLGADIYLPQVVEGGFRDLQGSVAATLGGGVVAANDVAVAGEVEIAFDAVGILFPRELKRGDGVFGGVKRRAAMGDDFRLRDLGPRGQRQKRNGRNADGYAM